MLALPVRRNPTTWLATAIVLLLYFVIAAHKGFRAGPFDGVHYESLSDGYLSGKLSLSIVPDPALVALPNPYDPIQRGAIPYVWDASYFQGKFYLYFTSLPALLVYIPCRLLLGVYPSGEVVGLLFAALGFIFQVAAWRQLAPRSCHTGAPAVYAPLALGVITLLPSHLYNCGIWHIALLCGLMFASAFICATSRALNSSPSWKKLCVCSALCGLAIASRPSLLPLVAILAWTIYVVLKRSSQRRFTLLLAGLWPLAFVTALLLVHNALRFGDPFETGIRFQLQHGNRLTFVACHPLDRHTLTYLGNALPQYLFAAPIFHSAFPFVTFPVARMFPSDLAVYQFPPMQVAGLFAFFPAIPVGLLGCALLAWRRRCTPARVLWLVIAMAGVASLTLVSLCSWIIARYELDAAPALGVSVVVALSWLGALAARRNPWLYHALHALLAYSILIGFLIAFVAAI